MMKKEIIRFDFRYKNQDIFCINSKNSLAYNLIQSWPKWQNKIVFIYGPKNCGKTTISKIWIEKTGAKNLEKKNFVKLFNNGFLENKIRNCVFDNIDCLIEENNKSFQEKILNFINIQQSKIKSFILMTSEKPPRFIVSEIKDLISRLSATTVIEVKEPDEELLKKIIKTFLTTRNIEIENKFLDFICNRIERTYSSAIQIAKQIDIASLESHSKISHRFLNELIKNLN